MISKIIALIIALIFIIASPVYGAIVTPETPVSFGKGTGTSIQISTPEELNEVIARIPSVETYLTNDNILEVDPDFRSFTMVEIGGSDTTTQNFYYSEGERLCRLITSTNEHVLEMCFGTDALYYHVVGEMIEEELIFGSYDNSSSYNSDDFREGERTRRTFDIEVYYSSKQVLFKYNDFDIYDEVASSYDMSRSRPVYELREVDEEDSEARILNGVLKAMEDCFGIWMSPETISEDEIKEKLQTLTEEEAMVERYTIEFVNELSSAWVDEITTANSANTQYIIGLSGFITNMDKYFDQSAGNYYIFASGEDNRKEYFSTFGVSTSYYVSNNLDVRLTFSGEQVMVEQEWYLSPSTASQTITLETVTKIKDLGNTVCEVGDDAKIDTAYNVFGKAIRGVFEEMVAEEGGNN